MTLFAHDHASHLHEGDFHDSIIGENRFQNQVCNAGGGKRCTQASEKRIASREMSPMGAFWAGLFLHWFAYLENDLSVPHARF